MTGVGRPDSEGSLGSLLQEGDILGEIRMVGVGILGYRISRKNVPDRGAGSGMGLMCCDYREGQEGEGNWQESAQPECTLRTLWAVLGV